MVTWSARAVPNRSKKEHIWTGEEGCHGEVKKKSRGSKENSPGNEDRNEFEPNPRGSLARRLATRGPSALRKCQRAELDECEPTPAETVVVLLGSV